MTAFSQIPRPRLPPRHVVLPPEAFADDWSSKPTGPVSVGLRFLSDADLQVARTEAARQAVGWYADHDGGCIDPVARAESYNDGLMRWAVARATCDPNDITAPYLESAEDMVRLAFTPEGIGRLWDELVLLHVGAGVRLQAASDEDVARLAGMLAGGALARLPAEAAVEIRKLLAHCLEQMGDDPEGAEAVYVARGA